VHNRAKQKGYVQMRDRLFILMVIVFGASTFLSGCESKAQTGAGLGAIIGGGVGQAAGGDTESTLLGAAIGAGAGYIIGSQQENEEVEENPEDFVEVPFTNSDGTTTTIALRKVNGGYVGPENEYYEELPSKETLKKKYGS
jgi:outer membrane lipoprotein SlyB